MNLNKRDIKALQLLKDHPQGLYANEVVIASSKLIRSWHVYDVLERLVDAGLVREVEDADRTRHFITDAGTAALAEASNPKGSAAENLYWRLHSLSKALESSVRIDEHDQPDAYATVLDAMNFVRKKGD